VVSISIAFLGIVLVGSFTAAITSYIVRDPPPDAELLCDVNQRLERVEALLLELKARQ
jgi:hypothetical protein